MLEQAEFVLGKNQLVELMDAVIAKGKPFRFQARGRSMSPFIKDGDVLILSPIPDSGLRRGDIVAALAPRELIVHRIVAKKAGIYLLKGDNNVQPDAMVEQSDVLAVVMCIERHGEQIRIGMGLERSLIAMLSRTNLLIYILHFLHRIQTSFLP